MDSDSDSDGSHISATPPRDQSPPRAIPPHHIRSSPHPPPKLRVYSIPSSISLPKRNPSSIPLPKSKSKPKLKPEPKSKNGRPKLKPNSTVKESSDHPHAPSFDLSNHRGFSIKFQTPSDGGDRASSSSFSRLFMTRRTSFDPSEFKKEISKVSEKSETGDCLNRDENGTTTACASSIVVEPSGSGGKTGVGNVVESFGSGGKTGVGNVVESFGSGGRRNRDEIVKTLPNWIGGFAGKMMQEPPKRMKFSSEGNFVRLNINGYGKKYGSKHWKKRGSVSSSSSRFRRKWRKCSVKGGDKGDGVGNGNDFGYLEEDGSAVPDSLSSKVNKTCDFEVIKDILTVVCEDPSDDNLSKLLKLTHGYDSFREGQLETIKRVIARQSTMLILPTGAGKSLCYQLPALVLPGLTLVVSPLVALMVDQLQKLPPMIPGGLLCSNQTIEEANETLDGVRDGSLKVLFVSPERFVSAEFLSLLGNAPAISLLVIDEAHCLSEWSHNFRPSYLRLKASILRTLLQVECFLAMTATATTKTLHGIMHALEIEPINLIKTCQIRDNLQLHVTWSDNRLKDLIMLLKTSPLCEMKSIIVYCKFQSETDNISKYLRDNNISSKSYHSGIPSKDRSRIQELFCSNKIKVIVATVAFGMGLDKSNIGAVIHYSLPASLEEYVQETGRAGRDGTLSHCHLLLDDSTYYKLRSFLYSDGTDEYAINKLLCEVFRNDTSMPGQLSSMVKDSASKRLDMKEEVILTILTQLELGDVQYLILYPPLNVTCSVYFHMTSPPLLADKDSLVAAIIAKSEMKQGHYVFDIPTIANSIGIETMEVLNHLQKLKFVGEITFDIKDPAFCYRLLNKPEDICNLTTHITRWLSDVQSSKVWKLDMMFNVVNHAVKECKKTDGCSSFLHTKCMQRQILDYFGKDHNISQSDFLIKMKTSSPFLRADIKVFLQSNSFAKFTPRAVARIMHGVSSPSFPSANWSKCHFWGRYSQIDFAAVMEAARLELMNFVGKGET